MFFNKLFKKKTHTGQNTPSLDIDFYINDIASLLNINVPQIERVACLYESNYLKGKKYSQRFVQALPQEENLQKVGLPPDASFLGALYLDDTNLIYLSSTYSSRNPQTNEHNFIEKSLPDLLFAIAHELRHVWQKTHDEKTYFTSNAIGIEVITDPSEIDADAFALSYILSNKTPFTASDLPVSINEMKIQGDLDGGKRWEQAMNLSETYGFGGNGKIKIARG